MTRAETRTEVRVRDLRAEDRAEVIRIDALHTGASKPEYWGRVFDDVTRSAASDPVRVGLAAEAERRLIGYLVGEVRAFEFGSDACGWVHAIGVEPEQLRGRIATRLLAEACRKFREAGVRTVRTMVRRNDVPVLSFFRSNGFVGGSFVQLELDLEEAR
jgi:ribosomal protein S18 acetylase RimI-like enzyme